MQHLPDAKPLRWQGDLAARMVAGMDRYLRRTIQEHAAARERHWRRDLRSWPRYLKSVQPNRQRLAKILGVIDERVPVEMQFVSHDQPPACKQEGSFTIHAVRWTVLPGLTAEGLLLEPAGEAVANIIALGDADWPPDALAGLDDGAPAYAAALAAAGCRVLIPTLIDRDCEWSGVDGLMTNQPHREFIYRAAYELGRHVIGLEIQKILAAVDWFSRQSLPIGLIGHGEGGLLAFDAAALDERIAATVVSGYFGPRETLFTEPIYRNVWRLVEEFGDAEVATLIAPRKLIVEHCPFPAISGPPPVTEGRSGAAPGAIPTPPISQVRAELDRARKLLGDLHPDFSLIESSTPGSPAALATLLSALEVAARVSAEIPSVTPPDGLPDAKTRLKRQFDEMVAWTQALMHEAEYIRKDYWAEADATDLKTWVKTTRPYRRRFHEEIIGALPLPDMPLNTRARQVYRTDAFTGYEVVLDVYPDVFAYGILLVPHDLQPGERRPVLVCQHGLEGRPQSVANPDEDRPCYKIFACRLAERGYVTFSPQNPYIGGDAFRILQRMANPLGLSLYSFIIEQNRRILDFLKTLPYVDPKRIGYYGLSYGGKTALRLPAILEGFCLSICSGDFDEWIWKNCSTRERASYMRTGEYEMPEFDLGMTFNHAEMTYLICPRPFMVERGHWDGCASDSWVAYEYAKTRYRYDLLDIGDRTEIEYFNGPHEVHIIGTFDFLDRHLKHP